MLDEFQLCLYDQSTKGVKRIIPLNKNANYCDFCPLEYWADKGLSISKANYVVLNSPKKNKQNALRIVS